MVQRKRRYRRPANRRKIYGAAGSQLYKDVMQLKRMINVEYKTLDQSQAPTALTTTISDNCLNKAAQGDTTNTRDGNSIKLQSVSVKNMFQFNSLAGFPSEIRLICFIDTMHRQTTSPNYLDYIDTSNVLSHRNTDFAGRFHVIADRVITVSDQSPIKYVSFAKELNTHTKFEGAGGAASDITTNPIYLAAFSNDLTNPPNWSYNARVRYVDN